MATIAVVPSTVQEMYELTVKAFNLADRFRVPTFVMSDETIGHMRERITIPDSVEIIPRKPLMKGELPFAADDDGVPGFPQFGGGHRVHVTGLTHDERGYPNTTDPDVHEKLVTRLYHKVESKRHEIADYDAVNTEAEVVFVTYGPGARTVRQVLHDHPNECIGHLNLRIVWPFPEDTLKLFSNAKTFIVPELNLGQMAREVARHMSGQKVLSMPKIGGLIHTPAELYAAVEAER
jgi:2-oxoglutarate ferredoxin oxidoreductase subunit alpha